MMPYTHPCTKLVDICAKKLDNVSGTIKGGELKVTISVVVVRDMLCIPTHMEVNIF